MNTIMNEACRICKQTKAYTASEFPLSSGVACADCTAKTSETFQFYYNNYANSRPTPKQMKDNIAFLHNKKSRYEAFAPNVDSCLYTVDTLVMADFKNRMLAIFPTDSTKKHISVDLERFRREKNCEIFMFEDIKEASVLNSVNSQERFIMLTLKNADAGFAKLVVIQRDADNCEVSDLDSLSQLFGYVLQSRRQK